MKVETYVVLSREEIQQKVPYAIVCETMEGSRWETGKRKRLFAQEFTEGERAHIYQLRKQAHSWYLVRGVPDGIRMAPQTLLLWHRLANFCAAL